jgi:hypothetical protein
MTERGKSPLEDPRVHELSGVPVYAIDIEGDRYRVVWVPEGMYGDGRSGWAVFDPDGWWCGEKDRQRTDPFDAPGVYATAEQPLGMILR